MENQFSKLIKWIKTPPDLKLNQPFLKAKPIKPLNNNKILYQVSIGSTKKDLEIPVCQSFQVSTEEKLFRDMCQMTVLNEPEILNNLIQRYKKDIIFTYIGPTLIVINPYKYLPKYFEKQPMMKVRQNILQSQFKNNEPHTFMIAGKAYNNMKASDAKQAIVISGESGAGKTESTKYCMKMLTSLSHPNNFLLKQEHHSIQQKILSCNPLLEAFGNSKTIRNDNSSRFGKYVQIFFGDDNIIKGANIQSYLLEKSRVVSIAYGERTFHAFYALIASKKYNTRLPHQYKFLSKSQCYASAGINDAQNFIDISNAMQSIEFQKIQQNKIWLLLKAILELGNLQFSNQQQQINHQKPCQIKDKQLLKSIAQILQIEENDLMKMLLFEKKIILKVIMFVPYRKQGCQGHRNTLCKTIYNAIFQFILQKIQAKLKPSSVSKFKSVSILDIFGFQNFDDNSLEQLCINFTNQKLLRLYNEYIFKREMELLCEDDLGNSIKNINPPTNDSIILMMNGIGVSIFSVINDNTQQQQYTDQNIKDGIQERFLTSNQIMINPKKKLFFTIKHSQCNVQYNVEGFKIKNLDKVNDSIVDLINNLKILKCDKDSTQKAGKTVLKKFSLQIQQLIKELSLSNVHFIRCIKPNQTKQPSQPVESYILSQVRYLGVFQTIQIRKKTFPFRKSFSDFVKQFSILFPNITSKQTNVKNLSERILKELNCQQNEFMLGNKRVYINQRIQHILNKMVYEFYKKRNQQIKKLQSVCKRFVFRSITLKKVKIISGCSKMIKKIPCALKKKKIHFLTESFQKLLKNFQKMKEKSEKQAQLKSKEINQMKKKDEQNKNIMLDTRANVNSKNLPISKERQQKLWNIKQKFFKYIRSIVEASNKMTLSLYFEQMKKSTEMVKKKSSTKKAKVPDLNETLFVEAPEKREEYAEKQPEEKTNDIKDYKFNESFYNEESVYISQEVDVVFTGNFKIQMYENSKENLVQLELLKNILAQKARASLDQSQMCSPQSQDSNFRLQQTPKLIMAKVVEFPIEDFFQKTLRKRTGVFGMKKDYTEILVFKPRPLTKTLTELSAEEELQAIKVFKLLLKISEQTILDNVFKLVENFLRNCQQTSPKFKNEIFLQLIKQVNNQSEVPAIRIYQTMSVFLHIYTPQQQILYAALHLFFNKIAEKKFHEKEEQFLRYLFKKIIHKLQKPHGIGYLPIKYQIMALMSKRQISIPIYLPIGNNILMKAESYETFHDIKVRTLKKFGINTDRIPPQFFTFFEAVNYDNAQLEESPVNESSVVWDVMTYWELAKQKYQESGVPSPYFSIMIKIKYPFECSYDDEQAIELYFAQCFFDYSMGRIRLQIKQMSMLAACIKKIKLSNQSSQNVQGCFPLWISQLSEEQTFKKMMMSNLAWLDQSRLDNLAIKFKFLEICSQCPLSLTFAIPTQHSLKIFFKPKRIYLVQKGTIVGEYSIKQIAKWSNNLESFIFQVKKRDGTLQSKTHVIMTDYSYMCTEYLNKVPEFLLKYRGSNKKKNASLLKEI